MNHALIFANGDVYDGSMVRQAIETAHNPDIIAADGGARVADYYGLRVQTVVGDMDSLSAEEQIRLRTEGAKFHTFSEEKDYTDLELALKLACERGASWIRIIGGLGDRIDQTIGNVYLLGLPELADCDVRMVAGKQAIWMIRAGIHHINGKIGDTISLIPVGGAVCGIRTDGLHYPLKGETLEFGPARGMSNVLTTDAATIEIESGVLLIVHTEGKA